MHNQTIEGDMRVWNVLQEHPETYEVFRRFGCPDMRKGFFAMSAHIMKISWAARVHHIELDRLLSDLNRAIERHDEEMIARH